MNAHSPAPLSLTVGPFDLRCETPGPWTIRLDPVRSDDGADIVHLVLDAPAPAEPPRLSIGTKQPLLGTAYQWKLNNSAPDIPPEWMGNAFSELALHAPLHAYYDGNDTCHAVFASSECARRVNFNGGVLEENCLLVARFSFFDVPEAPLAHYETFVRAALRPTPFADAIRAAAAWIGTTAGYIPCPVPDAAFDPLYSSWYNFHQNVTDADLEAEFAIAARLGMRNVIVDDGWQTDDNQRGYAFSGDWVVSKNRFSDMRAHVARAHALGLKYILWYSVSLVGTRSESFRRFQGKFLYFRAGLNAWVLDPRFPEVREFLIETYVKALRDWDLDGFKLDFIDSFRVEGEDPAIRENYAGRDIRTVPAAVDRLMRDVSSALRAIRPDILIEFRQAYDGPAIRQYGNLFRVGDCPGNFLRNRVAIANLRLTLGDSAVHSDMLEWNAGETPERAALYVLNSLFGVVQYSVMLRDAPESHLAMIRHWIDFSQRHRHALLHGDFTPRHPELLYPVVESGDADERIVGVYGEDILVRTAEDSRPTYLLNATGADTLPVEFAAAADVVACDTFGAEAGRLQIDAPGIRRIPCPRAGYLKIVRARF